MTITTDLKTEGQQRSLQPLTDEQVAAFLDLIEALPDGTDFSVNLLRAQLDALEVPDRARAALFNKAVKGGLIEPLMMTAGPWRVPVTESSTGRSAHRAKVRVYTRTSSA